MVVCNQIEGRMFSGRKQYDESSVREISMHVRHRTIAFVLCVMPSNHDCYNTHQSVDRSAVRVRADTLVNEASVAQPG